MSRVACRDGEHAVSCEARRALGPVVVDAERGELVVIQACAHELLIFEGKPQRLHEVQSCAGICTETDDVTGVRRDLGLIQDDVEHSGDTYIAIP